MKNLKQTPLNPETENDPVREEQPVPVTMDTETTSNEQISELPPVEEPVPAGNVTAAPDLLPDAGPSGNLSENQSEPALEPTPTAQPVMEQADLIAELPEETKEELPVEPKDELPEETKEELPVEPKEELPVEPKEELPVETKDELPVEPKKELPVEPKEELPEEPKDELPEEPRDELPVEPKEEHSEDPFGEHPEDSLEEELAEHSDEHLAALSEAVTEQSGTAPADNYESCTREELIGILESTVTENDINAIKAKVALIKVAFLKKKKEENLLKYENAMEEGSPLEELATEQDELDIRFNHFFNIYKANKARHLEEQEKIKIGNLKQKNLILDELKSLINSEETLKKTYDEFKTLQERWKEVGMVPRTEVNNLWQNYHFLVEKFFEKVKLNKELKDLDLRKNLEAKMALCEKTEELLLETSILKSFKKLQKYHEEWKEIGPVPTDKKDEIWERFKTATDKINERRREHYAIIENDQLKNQETKTALCEQAELVVGLPNESIKDWQENTNKVNDLLKIWKNIGPVPQKYNVEIWNRFKASLDQFFSNKKEYFDKLKEQQLHNYNLKVELCMQAEALKTSADWKKTSNELIRLQGEWKKIGPVPRKHSDKIWKRFRSACDDFFNARQAFFSNIQASESENLSKKLDVMKRIREYVFTDDKPANLEALKNFQREWTEIGHIPIKEKDKIQNEFRTLINEHLDKLKISEVEMSAMNFQARVDHLKNDPNARRVISKEREFLSSKITKMKEEITLWENNIGFFAKSKSAAIVKEEFENKINRAKSELKVLEAKMKILRQQG